MKHLTTRLIVLPIVIFCVSIVLIISSYFLMINSFKSDLINYEKKYFLSHKKKEIKNELTVIKNAINSIINISYDNLSLAFKDILYRAIKEYKDSNESESFLKHHFDPNHFFFLITSKSYKFPKNIKIINENNKKFAILNGKKYYVIYKIIDKNKMFAIAIKDDEIEKLYLKEVKKLLDKFNKNRVEYVAMGKITNFNPKDGNFGKIIYMPPSLKNLEGKLLNYNKADINGKYYRKEYLNAFKNGKDEVFLNYFFKNPKTSIYEKKYSYFTIIRPYNYVLVKGFYESEIKSLYQEIVSKYKNEIGKVLGLLLIISILILIFGIFIIFKLSNEIVKKINIDYENLKNELFKKFYYDDLTGIFNRNKLLEDIEKFNSLILIDIYNFSVLNEIYGFEFGDKVLKYFSNELEKYFNTLYRVSSDEFAIGFITESVEEEIDKIFSCKFIIEDIKIDIEVGASNIKPLLQTAEIALKEAKERRKKIVIYDEEMFLKQKEKLEKINLLKKVLEKEDIIPFYQGIVNEDGKCIKYEALMRIKIDNKIYSPFMFMELLKESNLYIHFSKIMIKKVFKDINSKKIKNVSINLSFEDINNEEIKNLIFSYEDLLKEVTFEILESEEIKNYEKIFLFLEEVKKRGAKIAVDDFGSGYSNLVEILKIKPDFIKIDGSLVKNLNNEKYFKIVKLLVDFCKEFNIYAVAEFVENEDIFNRLKDIGVDYYQGYYFYIPKSINELKNDKIS